MLEHSVPRKRTAMSGAVPVSAHDQAHPSESPLEALEPPLPLDPAAFAEKLADYWSLPSEQGGLGNVTSPALVSLWTRIGKTYSKAISDKFTFPQHVHPFTVVQCPTGSAKTQGLCLYAAETSKLNAKSPEVAPIGVLIVVRLIAQADEVVDTVNRLAGFECAAASHSGDFKTFDQMKRYPVLVVTHAAYTNAVRRVGDRVESRYEDFLTWSPSQEFDGWGYRRGLVVIDEALANVVDMAELSLTGLNKVLTAFDHYPSLDSEHSAELEALEALRGILKRFARSPDEGALGISEEPLPALVEFDGLLSALDKMQLAWVFLKKKSNEDHRRLKAQLTQTIKAASVMLQRWHYLSREGNKQAFNSARFLIPEGLADGAVFLDATAENSFLWELIGDRQVHMVSPEEQVRDYSTTTVNVCWTKEGLGKTTFSRKGKHRVPRLLEFIKRTLKPGQRALIATHKDIEPLFLLHLETQTLKDGTSRHFLNAGKGAKIEIGLCHFGAIDGRNDWSHFDNVFAFGLPYLPQSWSFNVIFALTGFNRELLKAPEMRGMRDYPRFIAQRQMSTSLIQLVNRIRTRRVVDVEGRCLPANVWLWLPQPRGKGEKVDANALAWENDANDEDGAVWLKALEDDMPGVNVTKFWQHLDGVEARLKKNGNPVAVVEFMRNRAPGEITLRRLQLELSLSPKSFERIRLDLSNPGSTLARELESLSVTYEKGGRGRGNTGKLVKHK